MAVARAADRRWSQWLWLCGLFVSLLGFVFAGGVGIATGQCGQSMVTSFPSVVARSDAADPEPVTVRGVVTGTFTGRDQLNGFFLQQMHDAYPHGLFVYAPSLPEHWNTLVRPGNALEVDGRPAQWRGQAQLAGVDAVRHCGTPGKPSPQIVEWPADAARLSEFRNLLITLPQPLTVTGSWDLERFGSLDLAAERLQRTRSGIVDDNAVTLILDDGRYQRFPNPVPYLDPATGTRRVGDRVAGLRGVLVEQFDAWRVHPTQAPVFTVDNPRPPPPERSTDTVRIAAFNLENHFITVGARGAADTEQLAAQRAKLLAAIAALDADLLGLIELENHPAALESLLSHINTLEIGTYRAVPVGYETGSDAIRLAWIYREDRLEPAAPAVSDSAGVHHRPPLMAIMQPVGGGRPLLAALVHFKSKGRCPRSGDIDRGDGCWNQRREAQASALLAAVDRERPESAAVVLMGDFNAYRDEPPLEALRATGYVGAIDAFVPPERRYTFVFRGVSGMLDHAFVDSRLERKVVDAGIWHVNADEPALLGYRGNSTWALANRGTPWRSSDHDPIFLDLRWTGSTAVTHQPLEELHHAASDYRH